MSRTKLNGHDCYYEVRGDGDEAVVLAHGFMFDRRAYDAQFDALAPRRRCVRFDWRGQGDSEVPEGGYDLDTLAADVAALLDHLGVTRCHFVGASMGGRVGLRLARREPGRLRSLALLHTPVRPLPRARVPVLAAVGLVVRLAGARVIADVMLKELLSPTFLSDPARAAERELWRARFGARDRAGIARTLRGLVTAGEDLTAHLADVRVPTLVVAGHDDRGLSPEALREVASRLPRGTFHELERVAHCAPVEAPAALTALLEAHFARASTPDA